MRAVSHPDFVLSTLRLFCLNKKNTECTIDSSHLGTLCDAGIVPIFDYTCNQIIANQVVLEKFNKDLLTAKFWSGIQQTAIKELVHVLNEIGIVPVLLKGISIANHAYPHPFLRRMSDIDILVSEDKVDAVENVLKELGYEQRSVYDKTFYDQIHHTMPWQHTMRNIWIEVHKALFPANNQSAKAEVFQIDLIIKQCSKCHDEIGDYYRASDEFNLVYIAVHWAETFNPVASAFPFIDSALLINKNSNFNWSKIMEWSNNANIANYVQLFLYCLKQFSFTNEPIQINSQIKHSLSQLDLWILFKIVRYHLVGRGRFGRFLTSSNTEVIWTHLLSKKKNPWKLLMLPWAIAFPFNASKRFNLFFQLSRIRRAIFFKR